MPSAMPIEERFWRYVSRSDGCWLWVGSIGTTGYGVLQWTRRRRIYTAKAHRLSWEFHFGPIPDGLHVLHICDNPPCVNPAHLFLGTQADNMRDAANKGRMAHLRGLASPHAKATPEAVGQAKALRAGGASMRSIGRRFGVHHSTVSAWLGYGL